MENLIESIEYYYDEDFSIPFDVGLFEENNNVNIDKDINYFPYIDIIQGEEVCQEYDDLDRVIMPGHIFSQIKNSSHTKYRELPYLIRMKQSYDSQLKRKEMSHSVVRMSCSSSPNSASSINGDGYNRILFDSYTDKMSFNESTYSLTSRMPLFDQNNRNVSANYRLHFSTDDYDTKFLAKPDSPFTAGTDSGKCSFDTIDSILKIDDPKTFFSNIGQINNQSLKPDLLLWRQLKYLTLSHLSYRSLLTLFKQYRNRSHRGSATTEDIVSLPLINCTKRFKRYSCSILEIFKSFKSTEQHLKSIINQDQRLTISKKSINHFSCQFPPKHRRPNSQQTQRQSFDYPGIGALNMPKRTRIDCSVFLSLDIESQLAFLQSHNVSKDTDITSSVAMTPESDNGDPPSLKPCLRKEDESLETKEITIRPTSHKSKMATDNFKRKSVSFDCPTPTSEQLDQELKEIPKKWGLLGSETDSSTDMMAVFECPVAGCSGVHDSDPVNDDTSRFREMVNDVLRAIKQISERLSLSEASNSDKVGTNDTKSTFHTKFSDLCDMIGRGGGQDTPLVTAIDNLITLLSDGLVVTSFSNKKVRVSLAPNKAAMRLWLLIEETCRTSSNSTQKLKLSQMLKEVRQMVVTANSAKDHLMRLRAFIATALKAGLMHEWVRSVVANDAALQRFYCAEAFLCQARTAQSDALAALTVSLKALSSVQPGASNRSPCPQKPTISKPVLPPPVKISRRFLPSPLTNHKVKAIEKPVYSEETTESESYADESRSSQSECPPHSNNNILSRHPPKYIKKSSTASNLNPAFLDLEKNVSPSKKHANSLFSKTAHAPSSIPTIGTRSQPTSLKIKSAK